MTTTNPVPSNDPTDLLFNAQKLDQVVNGSDQYYTDRLGVNRRTVEGISAAADAVLGGLGYAPPVTYASGISMTLTTQTVEYSGEIYAPKVASLPFTTSTWVTDSAKFRLIQGVAATDLAASGGAGMIGYMPAGTGAIATTAQAKLREMVSVKDFGANQNVGSDNALAIANAREASKHGLPLIFGGKIYASDFWGNLSPLSQEWAYGAPTDYKTDVKASSPVIQTNLFNAKPTLGPGFDGYSASFNAYTKPGVDVASTVSLRAQMQSFSTNSAGNNFNATYQVAFLANSSAMDSNASASVEAINAIVGTQYTGSLAQQIVGVESDVVLSNRPAGWFGAANANYSVAYSAVLSEASAGDGTVGLSVGAAGTKSWWHGAVISGVQRTGITIAREGVRVPETGLWVSGAGEFGVYVGGKNKWPMNAGNTADYAYAPAIGMCLGQKAALSASSHKIRFESADSGGVSRVVDVYTNSSNNIVIEYNGTPVFTIAQSGALLIGGNQVLTGRRTGYTPFTGSNDSGTALDTATVTLQQLAQRVAALQASLTQHGLIGS